jgi:hypothetical protein
MPTFPTYAYSKQYSIPSPPYKISSKSTNRFKSCTHLRSLTSSILVWLKLRHWIVRRRGHLQCHHLHTIFHPNPPIGSKFIKGFLCIHLKFKRPPLWNGWSYKIEKMWHRGHLQWHHLPTTFHKKTHPSVQMFLWGTHRHHTHRLVIS